MRQNKRNTIFIIIISIIAFAAVCFALFWTIKIQHRLKVLSLQTQIMQDSLAAKEVVEETTKEKMSDEDKKVVESIISSHLSEITPKMIADVTKKAASGNVEGLKELAEDILTKDEYETAKEIAKKYLNQEKEQTETTQTEANPIENTTNNVEENNLPVTENDAIVESDPIVVDDVVLSNTESEIVNKALEEYGLTIDEAIDAAKDSGIDLNELYNDFINGNISLP